MLENQVNEPLLEKYQRWVGWPMVWEISTWQTNKLPSFIDRFVSPLGNVACTPSAQSVH
jgi:hypothetical protein